MIAASEMLALRVPLAALDGLDPLGLRPYKRGSDAVYALTVLVRAAEAHIWKSDLARAEVVDVADVELSTADERTRDALARWLAERVGMSPASTAPAWHIGDPAPRTWDLRWWYTEFVTFHATRPSSYRGTKVSNEHEVPALGDLNAADPRRLPDGSRWVDAAALAAVARHVGGAR